MNQYVTNLNYLSHSPKFGKLEEYAKKNEIPIIQYEALVLLLAIIKMKHIKKILEIGTAIGYSSLQMASMSKTIDIDTIERDEKMKDLALENIKSFSLENQIHVHFSDALSIDLSQLQSDYDLIFIDAAKSQYEKFFHRFNPLLKHDGIIVTDNILFHGCVETMLENDKNLTKNVRNMAKKIDKYNQFLSNHEIFETFYLNLGDGLAITMRKQND
jgi:putative O-methyltransferase yrrM